jgi:hypothetical protein
MLKIANGLPLKWLYAHTVLESLVATPYSLKPSLTYRSQYTRCYPNQSGIYLYLSYQCTYEEPLEDKKTSQAHSHSFLLYSFWV